MDRRLALTPLLVLAAASGAADRGPPPSPACADARSVVEMVQSDDHTLAVRLADGSRFRLDLALRCPGIADEPQATLVSPGGWACGRAQEAVVAGPRACPIAHVQRVDARTYASHAMAGARAGQPAVLGNVTVTGERRRGFVGSPSYCVNTNHMRGWSEDAHGLIVEVSPVRSGGHRYYRVELGAGCQGLTDAVHLNLVSRVGNAMVCGFAGDEAIFSGDLAASGVAGAFDTGRRLRDMPDAGRCPVSEVYPLERAEADEVASLRPAS
ncbi:hypothetical protein [Lysobacter sp. N42]|jgi:hypothetical protein|uniref:hypothetical protein n=1 Tax=Lysobacter sp. N42 TaxID=2545719 RepID=UPI00104985E4|nr:hypothetical protein [Lysobacter sp. N42]TCZ87706.1 hypothetical protein EYQ95_15435 [Lysobacter sp. N42]